MFETETRALLMQWLYQKDEQAKAKDKARTLAAAIRHIHGKDVSIRALLHHYKME